MGDDSDADKVNTRAGDNAAAVGANAAGNTADRQLIDTRSGFQDALRLTLADAARDGSRELWLCDVDYADWPLGEVKVVEALTRWAYAHRKLTMLALDFEPVVRRHPRFVEWRRRWAHIVECRAVGELEASQIPTVLLASGLRTVRLFDTVRHRGTASSLPEDLVAAREHLDAVTQRSTEAFPATILGL